MNELDEAIKHAEEVAEEQEEAIKSWKECIDRGTTGWSNSTLVSVEKSIEGCKKCADEHRQLAEWLKELKELRKKRRPRGEWLRGSLWSEGCGMGEQYGYYYTCSVCGHEFKGGYTKCNVQYCAKLWRAGITMEEEKEAFNMAVEALQNNDVQVLENRLKHLLKSCYIAKFDEVNHATGEYVRNIEDADVCFVCNNKACKVCHPETCKYTSEPKFAINFERDGSAGTFF